MNAIATNRWPRRLRDVLSFAFSTSRHVLAGKSESANNSCRLWIRPRKPGRPDGRGGGPAIIGGRYAPQEDHIHIKSRRAGATPSGAGVARARIVGALPACFRTACRGQAVRSDRRGLSAGGICVRRCQIRQRTSVDCVRPIMQNKPQPLSATQPLPQIDPQLVAACKANNPDFGQAGSGAAVCASRCDGNWRRR